MNDDLEMLEENPSNKKKMVKAVKEFHGYIMINQAFILNYGDRYRHGETISIPAQKSSILNNRIMSTFYYKNNVYIAFMVRWMKPNPHFS